MVRDKGPGIIRQMVHEILHREQPLPAGRAAGHNDAGAARLTGLLLFGVEFAALENGAERF